MQLAVRTPPPSSESSPKNRNLNEADSYQKETVRRVALPADQLPRGILAQFDAISKIRDKFRGDRREYRNTAQMRLERPLAIVLVGPGPECAIAAHYIEHISQHFKDGAIGLGSHRGRPGIVVHAGHFPEQIPRLQFGDRVVVG